MLSNNKQKEKPRFRCPTCGKAMMEAKSGLCRLSDGLEVPDVVWDECPVCGEKLFDPENSDKVVSYKPLTKKSRNLRIPLANQR